MCAHFYCGNSSDNLFWIPHSPKYKPSMQNLDCQSLYVNRTSGPHMLLAITFCLADTNKPDFPTNILLRSYQKRQKYFVTFPNNLILVRSYTQKVMANNKCDFNVK